MRQLLLRGDMACVLCFERGRCKTYLLLKILREYCAYCMARNVSATMHWIERNISDEPSRIYATEVSKLLVDLLTEEWSRHGPETVSDVDSWEGDYCHKPGTEQARSKEAADCGGRQRCAPPCLTREEGSDLGLGKSVVAEALARESRGAQASDHGATVAGVRVPSGRKSTRARAPSEMKVQVEKVEGESVSQSSAGSASFSTWWTR